MGLSLSWLGLRGDTGAGLARLRALMDEDLRVTRSTGGWVVASREGRFFEEVAAEAVSAVGCEVILVWVEEHAMVSACVHASAGRVDWSVRHDADVHVDHVKVRGRPPAPFLRLLREALSARAGRAGVDYVFDVPIDLAEAIVGYRHDGDPDGEAQPALDDGLRLELPVMAVRNTVIFPVLAYPLAVGRPRSLAALAHALAADRLMIVVAQRDALVEDVGTDGLASVGTVCRIAQSVALPDGKAQVVIEALRRARVEAWSQLDPCFMSRVTVVAPPPLTSDAAVDAVARLRELGLRYIEETGAPPEAKDLLRAIDQPGPLADVLATKLPLDVPSRLSLLERFEPLDRARQVTGLLEALLSPR